MKMDIGITARNTDFRMREEKGINDVRLFNNLVPTNISLCFANCVSLCFCDNVFVQKYNFECSEPSLSWCVLCVFCDCVNAKDLAQVEKDLKEEYDKYISNFGLKVV
jgi:hypothetical protein